MTPEEAIDIVARYALIEEGREEMQWDSYPEIGEHNWNRVLEAAHEFAQKMRPSEELFKAAYQLLGDLSGDVQCKIIKVWKSSTTWTVAMEDAVRAYYEK
jgi:hypothetical protein